MRRIKANTLDEFVEKLQGKSRMLARICGENIDQWRKAQREKKDFDPRRESMTRIQELHWKDLQATECLNAVMITLVALGEMEWESRQTLSRILIRGEEE